MNPETQKLLEESTRVAQEAARVSGQTFTPGFTPQKVEPVSPVINAADLGNVPKIQTVPQPTPSDPTPFVSSLNLDSINQYIESQMQPQQTQPIEQERSGLTQRLTSVLERLGGRTQRVQEVEQQFQVPQQVKQLQELTTQIAQRKGEYEKSIEALGNQPIISSIAQGQQGNVQRLAAIELGALASVAQAIQGNIALAQQTAERTVQLEFEPMEQEIETLRLQLDLNSEALNRADKKRAEALGIALDERARLLDEQKTERKGVLSLAQEAAQNGADNVTINKILAMKSTEEAMSLASPFIGRLEREQVALDNQYKRAQIAKIQAEISETDKYDANEIIAYAQQYAATGQIPTGLPKGSFGAVAQIAQELPKQAGTVVNSTTGVADSKTPATEQQDYARLYNIVNNVQRLKELDQKRLSGVVYGLAGKLLGSNPQAEYLSVRKAIVDDMQRMQSGAALTEEEQAFYADYLPGRFSEAFYLGQDSKKKIENFEKLMTNRLNERLSNNGLSIYGYSKVNAGGQTFTVGDIIEVNGVKGRVNPNGTVTQIQ